MSDFSITKIYIKNNEYNCFYRYLFLQDGILMNTQSIPDFVPKSVPNPSKKKTINFWKRISKYSRRNSLSVNHFLTHNTHAPKNESLVNQ